jgi:hypothetical protein
MATIQTRHASIYWSANRVPETRNVSINLSADYVEDTVHGDVNRTYAPLFLNFEASVTGLYNTGASGTGNSAKLIADAQGPTSATFSIYIGATAQYFYGSGYVSIDEVAAPYDEFAPFNWSIRPIGTVGHYAV